MKLSQSTAGMTLIEVLIAAGLSGVLALGIASYMNGFNETLLQQRASKGRDEVAATVNRLAGDPRALRYSASIVAENPDLGDCLLNPEGPLCTVGSHPLTLYAPMAGNISRISGPPANPKRYTLDGALCPDGAPPSTQCPIEVTTEFVYDETCF